MTESNQGQSPLDELNRQTSQTGGPGQRAAIPVNPAAVEYATTKGVKNLQPAAPDRDNDALLMNMRGHNGAIYQKALDAIEFCGIVALVLIAFVIIGCLVSGISILANGSGKTGDAQDAFIWCIASVVLLVLVRAAILWARSILMLMLERRGK